MPLPPIVFLRHGETGWNAEGRLQGQRDTPLSDKGRAQALRNGTALIAAIPEIAGYDFVASPLSRARETMEIARRAMGLERITCRFDDRLKEIAFGTWEGFTVPEMRAKDPAEVEKREKDKWRYLPPDGESYEILAARVRGWLDSLAGPTFAVAHGGVGRVLRMHLLGLDPAEIVSADFPQDRVLVFRDGDESWV